MGGCADVDECLVGNGGCDSRTTCSNNVGGRTCGDCPAGYTGNGADVGGCADVDECLLNNGGCDSRTSCINNSGSSTCGVCPSGFTGNGADPGGCVDVDECAGTSFSSAAAASLSFDRPGTQTAPFPPADGTAASFMVRARLELTPLAVSLGQTRWRVRSFEVMADADHDGRFDEPHDAWLRTCDHCFFSAYAELTTLANGTWSMTGPATQHVNVDDESDVTGLIATGTFVGPHAAPSWFGVSQIARSPFDGIYAGLPLALNGPDNACSSAGVCTNTIGSYTCACDIGTSFDGSGCSRACAAGTITSGGACVPCAAGHVPDAAQTGCVPCLAGTIAEPGDVACRECPAGTIAPASASSACVACPRGGWSDDGVTCFTDLTKGALSWSTTGPVAGKTCLHVSAPDEAAVWTNVYLCVPSGAGWQLELVDQQARHAAPGFTPLELMTDPECFGLREPSDPSFDDQLPAGRFTARMHVCLGRSHPLYFWSFATAATTPGCDTGFDGTCLNCLATPNAADTASHTWGDDRICVSRLRAPEVRVSTNSETFHVSYCDASYPAVPECTSECAPGETREVPPGLSGVQTMCVPCPAGTAPGRAPGETWESCLPCPRGFFSADPGSDTCAPCPAGTYNDHVGAVDCRPCSSGTESTPGSASCQAPPACSGTCTCTTGFAALDGACVDVDECSTAPCPSGQTCTNTPGTFTCSCAAGQHWNGTACAAVAVGDFRTYRQADYDAATGAAATALTDRFATCFPNGLTVGDIAGVSTTARTLTLTSPTAVRNALPTTGSSTLTLSATLTNRRRRRRGAPSETSWRSASTSGSTSATPASRRAPSRSGTWSSVRPGARVWGRRCRVSCSRPKGSSARPSVASSPPPRRRAAPPASTPPSSTARRARASSAIREGPHARRRRTLAVSRPRLRSPRPAARPPSRLRSPRDPDRLRACELTVWIRSQATLCRTRPSASARVLVVQAPRIP